VTIKSPIDAVEFSNTIQFSPNFNHSLQGYPLRRGDSDFLKVKLILSGEGLLGGGGVKGGM